MSTRAIPSKLQHIIPKLHQSWESWLYHAISLLAVAAALGSTLLLHPLLKDTPAALFYVAVMVSSWVGGLGPGLVATGLSASALTYFFLEPHYSFGFTGLSTIAQLCVFTTAACLISYLNETRLVAKRRAEANFKAWRESEAQFAHLADANIVGIFEASLGDTLLQANDAFLKVVGYGREELLAGRVRWNEIMPPEYPMTGEPLQAAASQPEQEPSPSGAVFDLSDLKILVVDDEADMQELTLTILEAQGAEAKAVASAVEALTLLDQWQPNLLISDIGMPDMDGYMLLRQIRARSPEQGGMIPAIALTAYAGEIDQQQALAAGYQQHLAKPVEPDELVRAIAHLLDST